MKKGSGLNFLRTVIAAPPVGCVIWPFGKRGLGYGGVWFEGKKNYAHRVALILATGADHKNLHAAHGPCHNRLCINPNHLAWKTKAENERDKLRDGTHARGEKHYNAKLVASQILVIRADTREYKLIAEEYGINRRTVGNIKNRKLWGHLA